MVYSPNLKSAIKQLKPSIGLFLLCIVSAFFWTLDHKPEFYMGDSASYIRTAVEQYIPPDRSFVYGWIIRWIALPFQTLKPLLITQVLAGIFSCVGLAICLKRFSPTNVSIPLCWFIAFVLCIEPMHLMFQRYVLTEALTMPIFVGYLMVNLSYIRESRLIKLLILQVLGIALISMRMIFLPLVLINALILPWILPGQVLRRKMAHALFNLFLILLLHGGYCMLNGKLSKAPPAYTYWDGFVELSAWAPAVTVRSAANPQLAEIIGHGSEYGLNQFSLRYYQLWDANGIVYRIKSIAPDSLTANRWAEITARRAFLQDPPAVLRIAWKQYLEFSSYEKIQNELWIGRGEDRPVRKSLVNWLNEYFSADTFEFVERQGEYWQSSSLTKQIQDHSALWMLLLAQTPWLCLIGATLDKNHRLLFLYMSALCFIYMATVSFLTPLVITRLLYPLTIPFFLTLGWMISSASHAFRHSAVAAKADFSQNKGACYD